MKPDKTIKFLVMFFLLLYPVLSVRGEPIAGFDCGRAVSRIEKLVCGNENAATLDAKLAGLYKLSLRFTQLNKRTREQQANWIRNVRSKCGDLDCITRAYSERITEITGILDKHTRPIPPSVTAEKDYPVSDSPYCMIAGGGSWFTVNLNRDGPSISGHIEGVYDCGRKIWGKIDVKGRVTGNLADLYYEGGFTGQGWAKALVVLSGDSMHWQVYQEVRVESYEPVGEILEIRK